MIEDVDAFAGPGGWDVGARTIGLDPLGIELDPDACKTREAAGLRTLQADVTTLDPLTFAPVRGLIGSPPCTAFSNAGDRDGIADVPHVYTCARQLADGHDTREAHRAVCRDTTSLLVVEPLRFALALEPEWIALEQVPPVLELWQLFAELLRARGYSAWAGVLNAADYGVPQVRRRAFLMASRVRQAVPPEPTHARPGEGLSLFGELAPWVSMAEALGWDDGATVNTGRDWKAGGTRDDAQTLSADELAPTLDGKGRWHVGFPRRADTPSNEAGDRIIELDGTEYRERDLFPDDGPAPTLTEKARSWRRWVVRTGHNTMKHTRDAADMVPFEKPVTEPAPTLDGKVGSAWKVGPPESHVDPPMRWKLNPGRTESQPNRRLYDPDEEPAPTIAFGHDAASWGWQRERETEPRDPDWPSKRPATTVAGDPRIAQPGHKNDEASPDSPGRMEGAIRVTLEEAAALQGFPAGYPWQGTKSAKFRQVGNAVPPPLAAAVLSALADLHRPR